MSLKTQVAGLDFLVPGTKKYEQYPADDRLCLVPIISLSFSLSVFSTKQIQFSLSFPLSFLSTKQVKSGSIHFSILFSIGFFDKTDSFLSILSSILSFDKTGQVVLSLFPQQIVLYSNAQQGKENIPKGL
jgi:hypothetical protein